MSWAASTLSNGHAVGGYLVKRYDATSGIQQTILGGCSGTIVTTSCAEADAPNGQWQYSVTPVIATNWQGQESAKSTATTVPVATLNLAKSAFAALPQPTTGSVSGFAANEGVSYRLDSATALVGAPTTVNASGAMSITSLTIPTGTSVGTHTVYAIGNATPNATVASVSIVIDTTAPTASAQTTPLANAAGWNTTSPVQDVITASDGTGSGISLIKYTTDGTDPTTSGTAQTYGSAITLNVTTTIKYIAIDNAGNVSAVQSQLVKIDAVAPTNNITLSNPSGGVVLKSGTIYYRGSAAGSFTLTNTVGDAGSGAASNATASLVGTSTGWSHIASLVTTPASGPYVSNGFSWTAGTTTTPTETLSGKDIAGNTTPTTLAFTDDVTAPSGGSVDATGLVGTNSRYSTSTSLSVAFSKGADSGSGIAATGAELLRASASLTSTGTTDGSCGTYGAYVQIGANDPASPKADIVPTDHTCYRYEYVVADAVGNVVTYTSPDIKIDTTVPGAPSLAFSSLTNTFASGSTVYYRPTAANGAFTITASSSDSDSGIASYSFPTFPTGWSAAAGALGITTYSYSAANPTAPIGSQSVTATNNAGRSSPTANFSVLADSTAPSGGSVAYTNGYSLTASLSVTLATGSDTGSGINASTTVLQRASATLTGGVCGTFGSFATVASNPTSPFVDGTVTGAHCYQYQYEVFDNVGNQVSYSSASVARLDYANAVLGTSGLVNDWRLDEASPVFSSDSMTASAGTLLQNHTGELAATWTHSSTSTTDAIFTDQNRIRRSAAGEATYDVSATPSSADYDVQADVFVKSNLTNDVVGVFGRATNAASDNFYFAGYINVGGTTEWELDRVVNGNTTVLGSFAQTLTVGSTYTVALNMQGSTISMLLNGVQRASATDTTYASAGRAGIALGFAAATSVPTNSTGLHLDNFVASAIPPVMIDHKGTDSGTYLNGVGLGVAGAIVGDADTAAQFHGVIDYAAASRQIQDNFSIEFWFKSTQGLNTSSQWTGNAGLVDASASGTSSGFGVSLRSDGKVTAGVGNPSTSIVSPASGYNDGAWHDVVFTRTKASGVIDLYIDGVLVGTATGGTQSLTASTTIDFGRLATGTNYYAGSLDDVSTYNTALTAGTISDHYHLGHGS